MQSRSMQRLASTGEYTTAWPVWAATDRRRDVVAMHYDLAGVQSGTARVRHSPYGVPEPVLVGDLNHDGAVNDDDRGELALMRASSQPTDVVTMADPEWTPDADFNFDGVIDDSDAGILTGLVSQGGVSEPGELWSQASFLRGLTIGYAGMPYDEQAGAYLMRNRWHSPTLGRFISRDPAGYVDGMSLYAYVSGNPLKYWDPFGLCMPPESPRYKDSAEGRYLEGMRGMSNDLVAPIMEGAASNGGAVLDVVQAGLDIAGLVPGVGIVPDLVNAGISGLRGDGAAAALSLTAAIPVAGLFVSGAKLVDNAGSAIKLSTRGADAGSTTTKADDLGEELLRNRADENAARDAIADSRPGSRVEQQFQVTGGPRRVDVLDNLTAIESKVGRTSLTATVRRQIARDIKLIRSGQVESVEWHFARSSVTGLAGPSGPLRAKLERLGILIRE